MNSMMTWRKQGLAEKAELPADSINCMVIIAKPNKEQIHIDPRDLNKVIKCKHCPMKTAEALATKLSEAKVFGALMKGMHFGRLHYMNQAATW